MLVSHKTTVESTLHYDLVEHVNAEISLRSGFKTSDLELWLRSTFLFVRMQKNPLHYAKDGELDVSLAPEEALKEICSKTLSRLNLHSMVDLGNQEGLKSTPYGEILSRYSISFDSMLELLQLSRATIKELLGVISAAKEFSGIRLRQGEKSAFAQLSKHADIRYPVAKINGAAEKINLLIQGTLASLPLQQLLKNGEVPINPTGDILMIFRSCSRIVMAALNLATTKRDAFTAKNALALLRSVNGRAWEDSYHTLKQIEGIGEKSISTLAVAGLPRYQDVASAEPGRLELLLKRQPPFGHKVIAAAASLPHIALAISEQSIKKDQRTGAISAMIQVTVELQNRTRSKILTRGKDGSPYFLSVLTMSSDAEEFHDSRRSRLQILTNGPQTFCVPCNLHKTNQSIVVWAGCDNIAGSLVKAEHKPNIDPADFPPSAEEEGAVRLAEELAHLEKCPDFFADSSSEDEIASSPPRKALAVRKTPNKAVQPREPPRAAEKPQLLPNGKYRCAHLCKKRPSCGHLCCREGLTHPPKTKGPATSVPVQPQSSSKQSSKRETQSAQNQGK